jgi:SMODS-associating 4TM effector domain
MTQGQPSMSEIALAQNKPENLRLLVASGNIYRRGRRMQLAGGSLNLGLALASPLVLLYQPNLGPLIGAIAGAWLFVSRRLLRPFTVRFQVEGATIQDMFDCAVLGLPWNDALARRVAPEDVAAASRKIKGIGTLTDWYPADGEAAWPNSVLLCQRSNAVWGRRQHRLYGYTLRGIAVAWGIVGIIIAMVHGATTAEYLVTIALPSLPALLDATELADTHLAASDNRERIEQRVDGLLLQDSVPASDLREIQDQLFALRATPSIVPQWFYRALRGRFEADMKTAARQLAGGEG